MTAENGEGDEISLPSGRIVRVARVLQNWKSEKCQGNQKQYSGNFAKFSEE